MRIQDVKSDMFALILALLAPFALQAPAAAQTSNVPVLTIAVDGPVYTGQPVWVRKLRMDGAPMVWVGSRCCGVYLPVAAVGGVVGLT